MIRLILHTGRFRDMGYETAFSGSDLSTSERADAERVLAALRRGGGNGAVGVVFQVSSAGRGVDEVLAVLPARPLTAESKARVKADLEALHREALPKLLAAAGRAPSVSEARTILRRGLDEWTARLAPLLAYAPQTQSKPTAAASMARGMMPGWVLWTSAVLTLCLFAGGASIWYLSTHRPSAIDQLVSGPDACRPNGAEDDAEFESLRLELVETMEGELVRGDPFAALKPNTGALVELPLSDSPSDSTICERRQALARVHHDLSSILDTLQQEERSLANQPLWDWVDRRILEALKRIAALELPSSNTLCTDEDRPCLPWFTKADEAVFEALLAAYDAVSFRAQTSIDRQGSVFRAMDTFERELASTSFRSDLITLGGELHNAGMGEKASALLDLLKKLVDCPRPGVCIARAARALSGDG